MAKRIKQEKKFKKNFLQAIKSLYLDILYGGKLLDAEKFSPYYECGCYHTQSVEYEELENIFGDFIIKKDDVILDVGCGRGRIFNFLLHKGIHNKLYGVEIDKEIAQFTKNRLLKCKNVQIIHGNIFDNLKDDVTIFFMFCPFDEELTKDFITKLEQKNKCVKIIYYHPQFLNVVNESKWKIQVKEFYSSIRKMNIECAYLEYRRGNQQNN